MAIALMLPIAAHAATHDEIARISGEAFKEATLDPSFRSAQLEPSDSLGYSVTMKYGNRIDASGDTDEIARAFIRALVRHGLDPSAKMSINVCAEQTGLTTPSGKAGVVLLGCSHYNPFTESITFDPVN